MRGRITRMAVLAGAMLAAGHAGAVTSSGKAAVGQCRITAGSKLPADLNKALCEEVKRAVAQAVPGSRFNAEVTVVSPSRLAAKLTVNGKALPQQNFAVMDRQLEIDSIRRFARSLGEVAKTARR